MILKNEMLIAFTAALPVSELRGSIPLGFYLKEPVFKIYLISVIGNLLPIPALYFLLKPVSEALSKTPLMQRFFTWLFNRTKRKSSIIERFEMLGLIIFVAIPLPMTGAWTGCMAASLLKLPFKKAFPAIMLGVIIAGGIVTGLCLGGLSLFHYAK